MDNYDQREQLHELRELQKRAAPEQELNPLLDMVAASRESVKSGGLLSAEDAVQVADAVHVESLSRNELIRLVKEQQAQLNRADLLGMAMQAQDRIRPGSRPRPTLLHAEAFRLMTYRTEGGTAEMKVWNSRDGVTPFEFVVDGQRYAHAVHEMQGPFFDRPEGCIAQWETRTQAAMMEAWQRVLTRAVLAGRMTKEKAAAVADDVSAAMSWNLHIGLRAFATGKFTDQE